jgi:hypothetical protein
MVELDSDERLLSYNNQTAVRDIVQFVPFNEVSQHGPEALAKEVLAEIPAQVMQYYETTR